MLTGYLTACGLGLYPGTGSATRVDSSDAVKYNTEFLQFFYFTCIKHDIFRLTLAFLCAQQVDE